MLSMQPAKLGVDFIDKIDSVDPAQEGEILICGAGLY